MASRDRRVGGRRPKLSEHQQREILHMIRKGEKTAAEAARLFKIHPATVCGFRRVLMLTPNSGRTLTPFITSRNIISYDGCQPMNSPSYAALSSPWGGGKYAFNPIT